MHHHDPLNDPTTYQPLPQNDWRLKAAQAFFLVTIMGCIATVGIFSTDPTVSTIMWLLEGIIIGFFGHAYMARFTATQTGQYFDMAQNLINRNFQQDMAFSQFKAEAERSQQAQAIQLLTMLGQAQSAMGVRQLTRQHQQETQPQLDRRPGHYLPPPVGQPLREETVPLIVESGADLE